MNTCIYSGHCCDIECDQSCPALAETSYLLSRNELKLSNPIFKNSSSTQIEKCMNVIESSKLLQTVRVADTVFYSDLITYCGICKYWKGSRLHCTVYNLRYSQYIDDVKKGWSSKSDASKAEYEEIWSKGAKLLVVSNIDFVNFKDFECQKLLELLQTRGREGLHTIVVAPTDLSSIVGSGPFFSRVDSLLRETEVKL